jgi:hypothetical protein
MATLSNADKQNLNADQQKQVLALKEQWAAANAAGNTAEMEKAHKAAEAIRASSTNGAYSGGLAGNAYKPDDSASKIAAYTDAYASNNYASGGSNPYMGANPANGYTNLGQADSAMLNAEQQKQIAALKAAWSAAATQEEKNNIHALAESIRQSAGYTAGANGADYRVLGATNGGMTADQMKQWLEDYHYTNFKMGSGWSNGYDTAMNVRSKANKIRQQMEANDLARANAADPDQKNYLHQQNLALAQLLYQYAGHTDKTTWYNEEKDRWETMNPDVGYGYYVLSDDPSYTNLWKKNLGYTDEDIQKFANDTSYYYNFVDPRLNRLAIDESRGYTGLYSQFANGPYAQLLGGGTHDGSVHPSIYRDVFGDGFGNEGPGVNAHFIPIRDENGNVLNKELPPLKNNNAMSDLSNQFMSYVQNGVIQPGLMVASHQGGGSNYGGVQKGSKNGMYSHVTGDYVDASDPRYTGGINRDVAASTADDPNNSKGQAAYWAQFVGSPIYNKTYGSASSGGGGTYEDYINQMYAAALEAQMAQLKSSYDQNISELDASKGKVDDTYTEQKRQTTGTNAQEAANWREMANAYGLNSGTIGQAALAQNNQLQSNLNTLESAQAAAQAEIERQRTLLGQQYQLQINQAMSENNFQRAEALYQEAVRADEALRQQQQFNANLALQYAQLAQQQSQFDAEMSLNYTKAAASASKSGGGSGTNNSLYIPTEGADESERFYQLYQDAYNTPNPENYIATNYKKYGLTGSTGLSSQYKGWAEQEANYIAFKDRIYNTPGMSNEEQFNTMKEAWQKGYIGDDQYNRFLNYTGVDYNQINGI